MRQGRTDRPTSKHVAWQAEKDEDGTCIAPEILVKWAKRKGHDIRQPKHADGERGPEPRHQLQCVFSWKETETETLNMGECQWNLDVPEQPERYIEVDTEGIARVVTWDESVVVNLETLRVDGECLVMTGAEFFGEKRLNGEELAKREPTLERKTSTFW